VVDEGRQARLETTTHCAARTSSDLAKQFSTDHLVALAIERLIE